MILTQVTTGLDFTTLSNLFSTAKKYYVMYTIAGARWIAGVANSFNQGRRMCAQIGAARFPACYLIAGGLIYAASFASGKPLAPR